MRDSCKQAKHTVQQSDRRYQALIQASHQVVWSWDLVTQTRELFDPAGWWAEMTGQSPQEQAHTGWLPFIHPADQARVQATWLSALATGAGYEETYRVRGQDGHERYVVERGVPVLGPDSTSQELVGTLTDVTAQKLAERQLAAARQENHRQIITILESISDTFMAVDRTWCITYANQHLLQLVQQPAEAVIGHNLWTTFPHLVNSTLAAAYRQAMADRVPVQTEWHGTLVTAWYDMQIYPSDEGIAIYGHDVSERKRALEQLKLSEELFSKAFRASPDVLVISRQADGYIYEVNEHWEKLFGYGRKDTIGRRSLDLQLFADPQVRQVGLRQMQAQGYLRDFPIDIRDSAGKLHHVSLSIEPLTINQEACWLTIVHDLTEQKMAEERFHQMVEHAPHGMVMVDAAGKIRLVNRQVEQLFGYSREELRGGLIERLMPVAARQAHLQHRRDFMQAPQPRPMGAGCALFGLHKDGHRIPIEVELNPIETVEGQMILGTIVDISMRKQAEAILRQSEERLRLATEAGKIGIFDYDFQTKQAQLSPLFYTITQFPAALSFSWATWLPCIYPTDRPSVEQAMRQVFVSGRPCHHEYRIVWPDQSIHWVAVSISVVKDTQGQVSRFSGAVREITAYKQNELSLRELNKTLEQRVTERTAQFEAANKELEAFTYSVSHDLRAPLRALSSFSAILLEQDAATLADTSRHYLERIHYNARQMGQLIDDLLAFSRLSRQPLKKQRVAPATLVQQVLADLQHEQAGRPIKLLLAPLPSCQADPSLLKQVFMNLVENALKYTRQCTVAQIEIGYQLLHAPATAPTESAAAEMVYFVRDNGVGFDMRYADKLFGVFQRLHSLAEYEGTGVGLATVQRIIQRHGGRIWAQAAVGEGATFYFSLGKEEPNA